MRGIRMIQINESLRMHINERHPHASHASLAHTHNVHVSRSGRGLEMSGGVWGTHL